MPSIVNQIEKHEAEIAEIQKNVDTLEKRLRLYDLSEEERNDIEDKKKTQDEILQKHKSDLSALRFENIKTTIMSVTLLAVIALIYFVFTNE